MRNSIDTFTAFFSQIDESETVQSLWTEGRLAVELIALGLIKASELPKCLNYAKKAGSSVVEACIDLRLFTWDQLSRGLEPKETDEVFSIRTPAAVAEMKNWLSCQFSVARGAVILGKGTKYTWFRRRKCLNVGLIDFNQKDQAKEALYPFVERRNIDAIRFFLISPAEFQLSLFFLYDMNKEDIEALNPMAVHPRLLLYLRSLGRVLLVNG